jgi:predicted acylesterase/phospholipase RssA
MKAPVISGGGSKGAFAGGIAEYLRDCCISYEYLLGCSTGLLMPHLALGKIDKIKKFTPLSDKRHFNLCPSLSRN